MKHWILTDPHFDHEGMKKWLGRPDKFEEKILKNVERLVRKDDILICLGDVSFGNDIYWHDRLLNIGAKSYWLIRGNHDKRSYSWYHDIGWDFVGENVMLERFGKRVLLSHTPMSSSMKYDINIHGHFHNNPVDKYEPELLKLMTYKHVLLMLEHTYEPVTLKNTVMKWRSQHEKV